MPESNIPSPKRIQRKRTRGWKMPPNTVYVGRPGRFGNPFTVGGFFKMGDPDPSYKGQFRMVLCQTNQPPEYALRAGFAEIINSGMAVSWFRELRRISPLTESDIKLLRGKNLACWCKEGEPCHADVLLEISNQ